MAELTQNGTPQALRGARLRVARVARNLSQMALGERVGRATNTICRWERGQRDCLGEAEALAEALGVSPGWLAWGDGDGPTVGPA